MRGCTAFSARHDRDVNRRIFFENFMAFWTTLSKHRGFQIGMSVPKEVIVKTPGIPDRNVSH